MRGSNSIAVRSTGSPLSNFIVLPVA